MKVMNKIINIAYYVFELIAIIIFGYLIFISVLNDDRILGLLAFYCLYFLIRFVYTDYKKFRCIES